VAADKVLLASSRSDGQLTSDPGAVRCCRSATARRRHNDDCFMAVFRIEAFRLGRDVQEGGGEIRPLPKRRHPADGSRGVLYPSEVEYMCEQDGADPASM